MQEERRLGYPNSVGSKRAKLILDVNKLELDLDIEELIKDWKRSDKYNNKLHRLLVDDPLVHRSAGGNMRGKLKIK